MLQDEPVIDIKGNDTYTLVMVRFLPSSRMHQ